MLTCACIPLGKCDVFIADGRRHIDRCSSGCSSSIGRGLQCWFGGWGWCQAVPQHQQHLLGCLTLRQLLVRPDARARALANRHLHTHQY